MKKIFLGVLAAATVTAPLALAAAPANAAVERCQEQLTSTTEAHFTAWEPASALNQWEDVWTHDYTITVQPDGSFEGTGVQNGDDIYGAKFVNEPETIEGQILANNHISYTASRSGRTWILTDVVTTPGLANPNNGGELVYSTHGDPVQWKIQTPQFEVVSTDALNHGQYVSAQGGGKEAAHSCVGMPLNSNKNK